MKNRVSTYPGRVKLQPVDGQANTYDMTRADVPIEPGTPLNQQTLLQPSTAQYLRIPTADPTVDDALRHMPDRVEPIGTVKTSPALSLGDAWLPCDGSQVTFTEYPQLCQLLRGVSGEDVVWDSATLGITGTVKAISGPVFFDGKWKLAMAQPYVATGTNYSTYPITILTADSLSGPWNVEYTINKNIYSIFSSGVWIAATEEACVVAFLSKMQSSSATTSLSILWRNVGSSTWSSLDILGNLGYSMSITGIGASNGEFAIACPAKNATGSQQQVIFHTDTPGVQSSWVQTTVNMSNSTLYNDVSFSYANGKWILVGATNQNNGGSYATFIAAYAESSAGFQFTRMQSPVTVQSLPLGVNGISRVAFYNGKYYTLLDGYVPLTGRTENNIVLASSADLMNWEFQTVGKNSGYASEWTSCDIAAGDKMIVFANKWNTWISSDPAAKINDVTLPGGAIAVCLFLEGDTAYGFSTSAVVYHDYSNDTRLLPEISLSDDTTTYIKAKNELDVFEAQESGGD